MCSAANTLPNNTYKGVKGVTEENAQMDFKNIKSCSISEVIKGKTD